ncbi:MAG: hypothetical protein HKO89_03820 [Saprospiraceae bacterium]|nr:hypothetical protein [Saprospiraceae bacterium]
MNNLPGKIAGILLCLAFSTQLYADVIYVSSQQEFDNAHDNSSMNDTIIWRYGTYSDIFMDIDKDHLFITAENLGKTVFTGASRVDITGDYITLRGFQFLDGDIGTKDVINTRGSYNVFTQINIRSYRSYKYLRVREESRYVEITYCNFENRLNLDDQNILSILVDDTNPGYHKIQYCSFKNFEGTGNDLGIEPIRIGLSTQADHISRCLVEYCYFTQCDGDGELISSKASQVVYRYNTFENNPKAELVLRHGSEAIVYGNFFLNGKGGVRVREGQDHYIYNNYFYELDDRSIYLQNESSDPLDNINIAFNTIVDCSEFILGGDGSYKPTNVTIANNIFSDPDDNIFEEQTGTENWIGNIAFGNLGIPQPSNGMTITNPLVEKNSEGFFGLAPASPAIDAAQSGYAFLPQFQGIENIDTEILFDLMGQERPLNIEEKDLGSNEYPHEILIRPIATEENTGPDYNTSTTTSVDDVQIVVNDMIKIHPNPVSDYLIIEINKQDRGSLRLDIMNMEGKIINTISDEANFSDTITLSDSIKDLPTGLYSIRASNRSPSDRTQRIQIIKFIKSE